MKKTKLLITAITTLNFALATLNCSAQYIKLLDFNGANGKEPNGGLISDGTFLYGLTYHGGANDYGSIFKIKPNGTGYVDLFDFIAGVPTGIFPNGSLFSDGTFLYGTASQGGLSANGTIYKIKPDGTGFAKIYDFTGIQNGDTPIGTLISDGTFLYGLTTGAVFKIKPDGTGFTTLHTFDTTGTDGRIPNDKLISDGSFLYGTNTEGGVNNNGTIFKIKPDGTGYANLCNFTDTTNGKNPESSLISVGTFLYGMTARGGAHGYGTIFKIKPDGTNYTKIFDFDGTNGLFPIGSLAFDGTFLYGTTSWGGVNSDGNLFKIKPDGTGFLNLMDFDSVNGSDPNGSLIFDNAGFLYGMTSAGGTHDTGTIFRYQYCTNNCTTGITENNAEINMVNVYPNPSNGIINVEVGQLENVQIKIYDVLGKSVYQNNTSANLRIDLTTQPEGIYFINIKTNEDAINKKIVINH